MEKYYHYTSVSNLNNIMINGLQPCNGPRCRSICDTSTGVFLSKGMDQSIHMVSLMYAYYKKLSGEDGDKMIQDCKKDLQLLYKLPKNPRINKKIYQCEYDIYRANEFKRCGSFDGYLGGTCCLLSVEGIKPNDESISSNCRYDYAISPFNIKLVNIRQKNTNYYIYDFKAVLSYLMYLFPVEEVLKTVPEENHNDVKKLYKIRDNSSYVWFNPDYYELEEIPLVDLYHYFLNQYQQIRTLA